MNNPLSEPVTRVYGVISLLTIIAIGMFTAVLQALNENRNTAEEAFLAARTSRPFPYTSVMAEKHRDEHATAHVEQRQRDKEYREAGCSLLRAQMETEIEKLSRVPEEALRQLERLDANQKHLMIRTKNIIDKCCFGRDMGKNGREQ